MTECHLYSLLIIKNFKQNKKNPVDCDTPKQQVVLAEVGEFRYQ
jgi:hypothetical protein